MNSRGTTWRTAAAALLTDAQRPQLDALRQASAIGNTASLASSNELVGVDSYGAAGSAYAEYFGYGLYDIYQDVGTYLHLSATQLSAMNSLLRAYSGRATLLHYQVEQANLSAQLEFTKSEMDPAVIGNLIIGMDQLAKHPNGLVQLHQDLLALLGAEQRQRLQNLEDAFSLRFVVQPGICSGLVPPPQPTSYSPIQNGINGALFFDLNNPPRVAFQCNAF